MEKLFFEQNFNFFTPEESATLSKDVCYYNFNHNLVNRVCVELKKHVSISLKAPSYCRVEYRPEGHPWHNDSKNIHGGFRGWCQYSASILLTPKTCFSGGELVFKHRDELFFHYCDLVMWDARYVHRVAPSHGNRRSLILFFEGDGARSHG